jgi:hypothetical protein
MLARVPLNRCHFLIGAFLIAISTALFILPDRAMGTSHYVAASGSDSNDGTSKTTPWMHAPGMPSCTGSCQSYTPVAGDQIIFRGGDTWHFGNSGAAPFVGAGAWSWNWSGSNGSPIYIGVDQTWYSGSSWVRPVFNGDNPLSTSAVSSCTYLVSGGNQWIVIGASYVTLDNFEFVGMCWDTSEGAFGNNVMLKVNGTSTPDNVTAENLYFHGWTHTTAAPQGGNNAGSAFQGSNQQPGIIWQFNVIDGSDSDRFSLNGMESDAYIVQYSVFRYFQGNYTVDTCHKIHDNLFEHIDNVTDGSNHSDVMQCAGEVSNGNSDPNLFYNNVFRFIPDSGQPLSMILGNYVPAGQADYDFNNVFHDIGASSNYIVINDPACATCGGPLTLYNNTAVIGSSSCIVCQGKSTTITSMNNHWIVNPATEASVFSPTSGVTETTSIYETPSTASSAGYASSNDYAPTGASSPTVGTGTNNSSFCNGLSDSVATNSCLSGTTNGCTYVTSSHSVSCPGITLVARPSSGAWDVGAYEWSSQVSGNRPPAPTSLAVTVQ